MSSIRNTIGISHPVGSVENTNAISVAGPSSGTMAPSTQSNSPLQQLKKSKYNPLSNDFLKRKSEGKTDGMPKYKALGMLHSGLDKDLNNALQEILTVPYFSHEERQRYLVKVIDGKLYQGDVPLDTSKDNGQGIYPFVMDTYGQIFTGPLTEVIHHSSFLAGGAVAGAGRIRVVGGKLELFTDESGHYMPPREYTDQVLKELAIQGIDLEPVEKTLVGMTKSEKKEAMKRLGLPPNTRLYPYELKKKYY